MAPSWWRGIVKLWNGKGKRRGSTRQRPKFNPMLEQFEERLVPIATLSTLPDLATVGRGGVVQLAINVDNLNRDDAYLILGGMQSARLVLFYDPSIFTINDADADIDLGTVPSASPFMRLENPNIQTPGLAFITIGTNGSGVVEPDGDGNSPGGSLLIVHLHVKANAPLNTVTRFDLAQSAFTGGPPLYTAIDDYAGPFNGTGNGGEYFSPNPQNFLGLPPAAQNNTTLSPYSYAGFDLADSFVTITGLNQAPVANSDSYSVTQRDIAADPKLTVAAPGLLANDSDPDSDPITAVLVSQPSHGAVTLNGDGSFEYTSTFGYFGPDSFTYKVTDGQLDSNPVAVTINVTPRLSIPTNLTVSSVAGTTIAVPVLIDNPNPVLATGPSGGLNGVTLAISFDPAVLSYVSATKGAVNSSWSNDDITVSPPSGGELGFVLGTTTSPVTTTGPGSVAIFYFRVVSGAPVGPTRINLKAAGLSATRLDAPNAQNGLPLRPQPTDASTDLIDGTINVLGPGAAAIFTINATSNVSSGGGAVFTVTALDVNNNVATGYAGIVHFSSSDTQAILPTDVTLTSGVGTFTATLKTVGTQTLSATDTVATSITGSSGNITVSSLAANHFAVIVPASATAGGSFTFTVVAQDPFNNFANGYTGTVQFNSSDTTANLPVTTIITGGIGTFTATLKIAGTQTLTATDTTAATINGISSSITVGAAAASQLRFSPTPTNVSSGSAVLITATMQDQFNNIAAGYTGQIEFETTDPGVFVGGGLPGVSSLTAGVGTFAVTLKSVGTQTISAKDTVNFNLTAITSPITVISSPVSQFTMTTVPTSINAGETVTLVITARDQFNNSIPGYSGTLHFTSTDSQAVLPINTPISGGVGTFTATLKTAGSQTITAADSGNSTISGVSSSITVSALAATHFGFSVPTTATAGNAFGFTVFAQDQFNNMAASYNGTVAFSSSDGLAVLPGNTALVGGAKTFSATLKTAGNSTLTAIDVASASISGTSSNISVVSGAADHFLITNGAANVTAGIGFSLTVTAQDQFNNPTNLYSGTVNFASSDTAVFPGNGLPVNTPVSNGIGTFSVTLKTAGTQTITVSDSVTASIAGTTGVLTVGAGEATRFVVSAAPSTVTAGTNINVTVSARDAFNNAATSYLGTVTFSTSDTQATLPTNTSLTTGAGTFAATLKTVGVRSITVADTVSGAVNGSSNALTVTPGAFGRFNVAAPASVTAGVAFGVTVSAADLFNNFTSIYTGSVRFSSTDTAVGVGSGLSAGGTLTGGVGTFTTTLKTAGARTVTAFDSVTSSFSGVSSNITVNAAAAAKFIVSATSPQTANVGFNFTVGARDAFNNATTIYSGTVRFTSTDTAAVFASQNVLLSGGTGTFTATLKTTTSAQTITATDSVTVGINGTSPPIVVSALGNHFGFNTPATVTAGAAFTFTVIAQDTGNSTITSYSGTVQFTSTDSAAEFPSQNVVLTSGVGTFTATLKTAGSRTLTASDTGGFNGTSNAIIVSAAAADHIRIVSPSVAAAGTPFGVTLTALDQFNNTATSYNGTIHFASTDNAVSSGAGLPINSPLSSGVGTFNVTLKSVGTSTVTVNDTVNSALTATTNNITVGAGAASRFIVSGTPSSITAGSLVNFTVTALDAFNNLATGYTGGVHFSSTDTKATVPVNSNLISGQGFGTFTATLRGAGVQTLSANDIAAPGITGDSQSILVSALSVDHFAVSPAATTVTAGNGFNLTVTAQDIFNNTATSYTGTVTFVSSDINAVRPGNGTLTTGVGVFTATLKTAGSQTITALDTTAASISGVSSNITVKAAAADHFVVNATPGTLSAGSVSSVTVTAQDAYNNTAVGYTGLVHLTSTDTNATLPASNGALTSGIGVFNATLKTAGVQTVAASDSVVTTVSGVSGNILVTPAAASRFAVSASPATIVSGNTVNVTVTAFDTFNNLATNYGGTVKFTSSDGAVAPGAGLPANSTLSSGTGTFTATLVTAPATSTITATDTASSAVSGVSNAVTVSVLSTHFAITGAPSNITAGGTFTFTVTAQDASNDTFTGYNGTVVFTSNDPIAGLPGNAVLTSGVGTFTATLKTAGSRTLTATDTVTPLTNGSTGTIIVSPGPVHHVLVSSTPASTSAGSTVSVTVSAQDQFNNIATSYSGSVAFTSTDTNATLPNTTPLTSGVGTFNATLRTAAIQTITVTDTASFSLTANTTVTVGAAATARFTVSATPTNITAGNTVSLTVTALDAFNNVATAYAGSVRFTSTDTKAAPPANSPLSSGVGTFTATLKNAGTQTITTTDSVNAGITGASVSIVVAAAPADHYLVSATPGSITAGSTVNLTVTAQDQFNNTATTYGGIVRFTSTDTKSAPPANGTLSSGVGNFTATLKASGLQTLTAIDTTVSTISGVSNTITVGAAATDHYLVSTTATNVSAGTPIGVTVTAQDAFNNTVTNYGGSVRFSTGDTKATLPVNSPLSSGIGTFAATLKGTGVYTIVANDTANASITGVTGNVTVSPAAANRFVVAASPSTIAVNNTVSVTVTAFDAFDNTATNYGGTVKFTSTDGAAVLPGNSTLATGTGVFTATLKTAPANTTITATDTASANVSGVSNSITVSALTTHFVFNTPATVTAGVPFSYTVTVLDSFNTPLTSYNGTVNFTSTDGAANLPGNAQLSGGVGTFTATLKTAGGRTLTATDTATPAFNGTSNTIIVSAAAADHLALSSTPSSITAGGTVSMTITAQDRFNNTITNYTGTIRFSSTDTKAGLPINSPLTSGTGIFNATLKTAGNQTVTVADTVTSSLAATTSNILVSAAATDHFGVTASPTNIAVNGTVSVTVTAFDVFNNTATNYGGTVKFSSTDGAAVLPGNSSLTTGTGVFTATLKTAAASTTITATDTASAAVSGVSNSITVSSVTTHFVFSTPATVTAGVPFNYTVTVLDSTNSTLTSYNGTVNFTSTDGAATLPGNAQLSGGVGTFAATLRTAGGRTITATDTATPAFFGTSNTIIVSAAAADHFALTSSPSSIIAGNSVSLTITAQDRFNNTATGYTGTVRFTSTDTQAGLPGNTTLTSGTGVFNATLKTAGNQTVTAADTVSSTLAATTSNILVSAAGIHHYTVTASPSNITAGSTVNLTVTAQDIFNNTATGYTGNVRFTSTDTKATLPGNSPLTSGVGNFTATLKTAAIQTITVSDTVTTTVSGVTGNITVGAAATDHFLVSASPSNVTAGSTVSVTVTALDQFNNTVTNYGGSVRFTSTDTKATLPVNSPLSSGTAVFAATLKTAAIQTITASDSVLPTISGVTGNITVGAAATDHFTISAAPTSVSAGSNINVTVTAQDVFNNTATGYAGLVRFSSTDTKATLPSNSPLSSGTGIFGVTLKTAGVHTVAATDTVNAGLTATTTNLTVSPAAANRFNVTAAPTTIATNGTVSVSVTAFDTFNNLATNYGGTVHFTSTDPIAVLPANTGLTSGAGVFTATLKTASTNTTITATDTASAGVNGVSNTITVVAPTLNFSVTAPGAATAGVVFNFTVTARDASNNPLGSGYTGTVQFSSTDTKSGLPASTTLVNGVGTFAATLKTAGNQTITAIDTANNLMFGTSGTIVVGAGAVDHFAVSATPSNVSAGNAVSVTVTALDAFNNLATAYGGQVHFTSTDTKATLPGNSTLTSGTGVFSATLKTAGVQTVSASDVATPAIVATSGAITVSAAALDHFTVSASPGSITAGSTINVTVIAQDAFNNTATAYTGNVHFSSTDTKATLPANSTLTSGQRVFTATLKTTGGQTVTATDSVTVGIAGTSNTVTVGAAAVHHFVVNALPGNITAGDTVNVTVTAQDQFNNLADTYAGNVHFSSTDTRATLPGNSPLTGGTGVFSATLITAGSQTITAADAGNASIAGTSGAILVSAAAADHFVVRAPSVVGAGVAFGVTVTAQDQFNNTATNYGGTVRFTSTDPSAGLPANSLLSGGVGTFNATLTTLGTSTITASDTAAPGIVGTSNAIVVSNAVATRFIVSAPSNVTAGGSFSFTVTAVDATNSPVAGYSGTVHFSTTDNNGTVPANATLTNGVGTFNATLRTAGNQTLTATDTANSSFTGTSNNISVSAGAATHLTVAGATNVTAGEALVYTVTAQDAFNNVANSYAGTVHLSSSDSKAAVSANAPLTNGVGFFAAVLKTSGIHSLTATDTVTASIAGTLSNINVAAATASQLIVSTTPSSVTVGGAVNVSVTAQDQFNNTATSYVGTVGFTSTDSNAVLPANSTLTNGSGNFTATLQTQGTQTITATDTVTGTVAGTSNNVFVGNPAAATHFAITLPANATSGSPFTFTITALDASNNVANGYSGVVHFSSSDAGAALPANTVLTAGVGTFTATLFASGNQTLTATDTVSSAISNTVGININAVLNVGNLTQTIWTVNRSGFTGTLTVGGGTAGYTLTGQSNLPPGLTAVLNGTTISFTGTPTTTGNFASASVTVKDAAGATITKTFGITINATPTLGSLSATAWTVNLAGYNGVIPIINGTAGFSGLSVTGLPAGLSAALNGSSIVITGTPTVETIGSTVSVSVTDAAGAVATSTFTLVINAAVTISPTTAPSFVAGVPYSTTFTASGGTGNKTVTYGVTGTLPSGVSATPSPATNSITISGTPATTGKATFDITATDEVGATASLNVLVGAQSATRRRFGR